MPDKPTLDAIRARLANHTSTLWMLHAARDVAALLEMLDVSTAQLSHEHKRANALAEYARMADESVANANRAGLRTEALLSVASAAVDELTREKRSLQARLDAVRAWVRRPVEARDVDELRVVLGDGGEVG